jgi:hypothetical protein
LKELERDYFKFQAEILSLSKVDILIDGYWQNPNYFNGISSLIRKEIFESSLAQDISPQLKGINLDFCCAIHVRRGDYLSNQITNEIHGVLDMDYYSRAMRLIRNNALIEKFVIFTDDPEWCTEIFLGNDFIILNPSPNAASDLLMMSNFGRFIIANSSFSWWGAWLSLQKDKLVVAPKRWFKTGKWDTNGLFPVDWKKI